MSLLRLVLRIRAVNRVVRSVGTTLLRGEQRSRFDRKLPMLDAFDVVLPNDQVIHWVPQGDIISKPLRYDGWDGYERMTIRLFFDLAKHARVTFDVGAYLGYFGLLAAAANPAARAYSFEAVPMLADLCRKLAGMNAHLEVSIVQAAVGDSEGMLSLYLPDDPFVSDTSTDAMHRPNRRQVAVPALTLDGFVRREQIPRVDLLKIDTETTEPRVLSGMQAIVREHRPCFICEVLPTARVEELNRFARESEYTYARIEPEGLRPMDDIVPGNTADSLNYLFFPASGGNPGMRQAIQDHIERRRSWRESDSR